MATELETKFLEVDVQGLERTLESFGAPVVFDGSVSTTLYDWPSPFSFFRRTGRVLRLRQKGASYFITFKGKKRLVNGLQECLEYDPQISYMVYRGLQLFFTLVGMESFHILKRRKSYALDNVLVEFDTHEDARILPYLEIEGPSAEKIQHAASKLGLKWEERKDWTQRKLYEYYGVANSYWYSKTKS